MKNNLLKSTIILLVGGAITKIFSMLIKIFIARNISSDALGTYMLIMPTFALLISLSQFGIPLALSKLIAEDKRNNKKLFFSNLPILLCINLILIICIILFGNFVSCKLLKNRNTYYGIISMAFVIPFTSISSVCRSYFFGKEKMIPHVVSNIVEDVVRFFIVFFILPKFSNYNIKYVVAFLVLINVISEFISTIILIFFLPKKVLFKKSDLIPDRRYIKDSLRICIPNTSSRLLGSVSYFFEPILFTNLLLRFNYSSTYITREYGIISGYVIPILLLPSFFTLAISQAILPVISREYSNGNIKYVSDKIKLCLFYTCFFGLIITTSFMFFAPTLLRLIYHTSSGVKYLRILAPFFFLQYIQSPLSFSLDAINKSRDNFYTSLISFTVRISFMIIFGLFNIGVYSLIFSLICNIVITTLFQITRIKKYF